MLCVVCCQCVVLCVVSTRYNIPPILMHVHPGGGATYIPCKESIQYMLLLPSVLTKQVILYVQT